VIRLLALLMVLAVGQKAGRHVPSLEEIRTGPPMLDIPPVAAVLRISKSYFYELIKRGEAPVRVVRVGSRYRVPRSALLALLGADDE
jgi:excisionase family DNA binding protein